MVHDDPYLCGITVKQNGVNNPWYVLRIYFLVSPPVCLPPKCTPTSQTHTDNPFLLPEVTRVNYSFCLPARTYCVLCSRSLWKHPGFVSPRVINNRLLLQIKQKSRLIQGPPSPSFSQSCSKSFPTTGVSPLPSRRPTSRKSGKSLKNLPVSLCKGLF